MIIGALNSFDASNFVTLSVLHNGLKYLLLNCVINEQQQVSVYVY